MLGWFSCCSAVEGEPAADDAELHRALLKKISTSANRGGADSSLIPLATQARPTLPELEEPRSKLVPLCLHRSCTEEAESISLQQREHLEHGVSLPRRCVSSELTGVGRSLRQPRTSTMHVEDILEGGALCQSPSKRLPVKRASQMNFVAAELGADSDITEAQSSVVYSSWFALLSKSMGSDVGSPSWLVNSTKQIEGA